MNATPHRNATGGLVVVLGSVNLDTSIRLERLPLPGETIVALDSRSGLGGKGANQAIAAVRAGAKVVFLGAVGTDSVAAQLRRRLAGFELELSHLLEIEGPSGSATILVNDDGENVIVLTPGANSAIHPDYVDRMAGTIAQHSVLVLQGEIPGETIAAAIASARASDVRVILNLAPYVELGDALSDANPLVVNEVEAGQVLGSPVENIEQALNAARDLAQRCISVVVTLGDAGAVLAAGDFATHYDASPVTTVVDSTGAGDAFVGVLAASLATGRSLAESMPIAILAGAGAVQTQGAAEGYPDFRPLFSADLEVAR
jgi:ribokinase